MTLDDYINLLKTHDLNTEVRIGLGNPHSWRGSYDQLAFEPVENTTIGEMLKVAESCVGRTFAGWKGGEFTMDLYTDIHVDYYGDCKHLEMFLLVGLLLNSECFSDGLVTKLKPDGGYSDEPFNY